MLQEPWRITLLGGLRAAQPSQTIVRFRTQQTGALLARLALFPRRAHPREELADLLWPDDAPQAARAKLRIALSSLRRQLEPPGAGGVLVADRHSVRLQDAAFTTDVAAFESALASAFRAAGAERQARLGQALALYGGDLLPGFYDDWIVDERHRLAARMEAAQREREGAEAPAPDLGGARGQGMAAVSGFPSSAPPESGAGGASVRLPPTWTRFFGREREREQIAHYLDPASSGARLVTLTGPGGAGKTRLALEAAHSIAPRFPRAVCFVGLADVQSPERLPALLAERLGLPRPAPSGDSRPALLGALAGGAALLILDNLEQMADPLAPFLEALLADLPQLHILATSRRPLGLAAEVLLPLGPLPTPSRGDAEPPSPESLAASPSVQLFLDRARAASPDIGLTPRGAGALAALCARLEGLPLALELAAAWSGVLSPAQMLERLDARFRLLVARGGAAGGRHGSLRAAIDWSFDLLPADLRTAFARLSVFRGGWTLEAAQSVLNDADGAAENLARLRERSLLLAQPAPDGDGLRFRLLESLSEYAGERLAPADAEDTARRHALFFADLAERAAPHLRGSDSALWLDRLAADRDNLRAALDWCLSPAAGPDGAQRGLRLAAGLGRFWMQRGPLALGRAALERTLAHPGAQEPTGARAGALNACGLIAWMQADYATAERLFQQSLAIRRALGDAAGVAAGLGNLGLVAVERRDYGGAWRLGEEALALNRQAGARRAEAADLNNLGDVATHQGRHDDARALYEQSLTLRRELGDKAGEAIALGNLGLNAAVRGDLDRAVDYHKRALAIRRDLADPWRLAFSLSHLADAHRLAGRGELAARLYGAAQSLRDHIGAVHSPMRQKQTDSELSALRASLGADAFASAYAAGSTLAEDEAVALALGE